MDNFTTSTGFKDDHPDSLVIQCSDGRYTRPVFELLKNQGCTRYDVMAMPGGPALLDMAGASILDSESCSSGTTFLIRGHRTRVVHLIAHMNCGYYESKCIGMSKKAIQEKQIKDMQNGAAWLRRVDPKLNVLIYYASPSNGAVTFYPIEVNLQTRTIY